MKESIALELKIVHQYHNDSKKTNHGVREGICKNLCEQKIRHVIEWGEVRKVSYFPKYFEYL